MLIFALVFEVKRRQERKEEKNVKRTKGDYIFSLGALFW